MIKASEIAEAMSAIDAAIGFVTETRWDTPGRERVRSHLIKSRVDMEFALKEIRLSVEADK